MEALPPYEAIDNSHTPEQDKSEKQQAEPEKPIALLNNESPPVACITFNNTYEIRLAAGPPTLIPIIREAILAHWPNAISQESFLTEQSYLFKLQGGHGCCSSFKVGLKRSRHVLVGLLKNLLKNGWHVMHSTNVLRNPREPCAMFFQYIAPMESPIVFGLSFQRTNWLCGFDMEPQVAQVIEMSIQQSWAKGIVKSKQDDSSTFKWVFKGLPWLVNGCDVVASRIWMSDLLHRLRGLGYTLYFSEGSNHSTETFKPISDMLVFLKQPSVEPSMSVNPPMYLPHQFMCITFNMGNKLRLIHAPESLIPQFTSFIQGASNAPLITPKHYFSSVEYRLPHCPWVPNGAETVMSRLFVANMLSYLLAQGWRLQQSVIMSCKPMTKSSLFFEFVQPRQVSVMAISLNMNNRLRVMGVHDPQLIESIRQLLVWKWGSDQVKMYNGATEFHLKGAPWMTFTTHNISRIHECLTELIKACLSCGYEWYAAINHANKTEVDPDTWYFIKSKI